MTAEVDAHRDACESEVSKGEVLNVNVNVNGNENENGNGNGSVNGNGISKDDADSSYVFVTGGDAIISEDPVESSDLNGRVQKNGSLHMEVKVGESVSSQEDTPQPHSLNKAADGEMTIDVAESIPQNSLTNCDIQSGEDPKLAKEVPVEDASRDLGPESKHDSIPTPLDKQVVSDPVSKVIVDGLPACPAHDSTPGNPAEQNVSSENGRALPAPLICENASFQVENKLAAEVGNGTVPDQSTEDGLLIVHAQEGISEPVVTDDLVDAPDENGSCENAESCEKVPTENGESFSTVADNDTTGNPDVENEVSLPTEDVSTCTVDDGMAGTDVVNLNEKSSESPSPCLLEHSKSEIEAEGGPGIEDTLSSFPVNDAISELNSKLEIEPEIVPIGDDTLSTCPERDAISQPNLKSEVEPETASIVDDTLSSCPANTAISEPKSKSEVDFETAPIVDDTLSSCPANTAISEPKSKSEVDFESVPIVDDTLSSCPANTAISEPKSNSEVDFESVPIVDEALSSCPANDAMPEPNSKSEVEFESAPIVSDTLSSCPANDVISEPKTSQDSIGCEEKISNDAVDVDSGLSNLEVECVASPPLSLAENNSNEASLPAKSDADDKPGSEVHSSSALRSRDVPEDGGTTSESRILNDSSEESGRPLNCNLDDVQIDSDVKPTCEVAESTDGIHRSEASTSSQEVSTTDVLEGQNKGAEVEKRPFYFLIRVPRYDDENLKEQIKQAQLHVEEKTKSRDAIRSKIQMERATCKEYFDNFEAARSEERAARDLFKAKRHEMDTVQLMINKVKNAMSVEDMDSKIRNMEHTMQHETLPLKEEKQYIREIKQVKQLREQLSSSLGKQDEVQQALDQKDHIEERSKVLRKEMDLLRNNLLKAETVTQAAKKKFNEENNMLNELLSQFRAADDIRQEAYAHLQSLRKQQYDKNKYFWRYKDDAKAANNLALSGNREQLQDFCIKQVETIMELWNKNDDFRKEYVRCNNRSTLRRLRTSDGRSLGPDEEPPIIPDIVRATKDNLATVLSTPEQAKRVPPVESEKPDDKSAKKVGQPKIEIAKTKKPEKPASSEISPATASGRNEIEDEKVEEPKVTKEEEELARKAEALRKEEAAARLREQRRLEEKAKAKEAQERKKRITEKAQARAAIRAQKEAEEKEKEREKRVKKKERKKATTTKATNGISEGDSAPDPSSDTPTETPEQSETKEKPITVTKRSQKSSQFTKQTKVKSIPLPLRNRSKRRMQPWMWVLLTVLVVLALFFLGNGGSSHFKSLLDKFF
ncbi:calponin homology domain-containing protein DDB_G0272472 isoform X2 [Prunus avium]|uniref:Calponin homology domain-containing protein DDB_G0272472 isoform X2 n=1 Tax=Prunus avium TaxID=42229 RepID=A0A6P5SPJ7_PRUAV|nr:calponin homology domain-containing protein DDB_G0272472 isoform X2 [Prunus avium]